MRDTTVIPSHQLKMYLWEFHSFEGVLASFPAFQCCAQKKYHSVCNIEELGGPGDEMGDNFWQDLIMS